MKRWRHEYPRKITDDRASAADLRRRLVHLRSHLLHIRLYFQPREGALMNAIQTGFQLKEQGMSQALAHAEEIDPSWSEKAYRFICAFANDGSEFRAEQVRAYAEARGFPPAPSARAWGSIIAKAACAGIIKRAGFTACDNAKAHACNVSIWIGA
jgi:hypothetical protein